MSGTDKEWETFRENGREVEETLKQHYGPDDMFVTLYYDRNHKPKDEETAKQEMREFFDRLEAILISRGIYLVATVCTEYFSDGPWVQSPDLHHHAAINIGEENQDAVIAAWTAGHVLIKPLLDDVIDSYELRALTMIKEKSPGYKEGILWSD